MINASMSMQILITGQIIYDYQDNRLADKTIRKNTKSRFKDFNNKTYHILMCL